MVFFSCRVIPQVVNLFLVNFLSYNTIRKGKTNLGRPVDEWSIDGFENICIKVKC